MAYVGNFVAFHPLPRRWSEHDYERLVLVHQSRFGGTWKKDASHSLFGCDREGATLDAIARVNRVHYLVVNNEEQLAASVSRFLLKQPSVRIHGQSAKTIHRARSNSSGARPKPIPS